MFGILDSIGYLLVVGILFFPVFWLLGYVVWESVRWGRQMMKEENEVEAYRLKPAGEGPAPLTHKLALIGSKQLSDQSSSAENPAKKAG